MNFEQALPKLRSGFLMRRTTWPRPVAVRLEHGQLQMIYTPKAIVPWVIHPADVLHDDWEVVTP